VEFRIYGQDASSAGGTWRIDNLLLSGSVFSDDSDGDGLPDEWELRYFHNATSASPTNDPDSDLVTNWAEYLAGSNPTNNLSFLAGHLALQPPAQLKIFCDALTTGRVYALEFGAATGAQINWSEVTTTNQISGGELQFLVPHTYTTALYRIRATLP